MAPENFDLDAYAEYEAAMLEKNQRFAAGDRGLLVYRSLSPCRCLGDCGCYLSDWLFIHDLALKLYVNGRERC